MSVRLTNDTIYPTGDEVAVPYWISGKVSGDRPPPCSYYTLTLVDTRRAVMFGGYTKTGRVNDVYIMTLDGINVNFKKMRKYGLWPKKRSSHAACVLNYDQEFPQLLMTGGLDENIQALGDLWLLSVDLGIWIKIRDHETYLHRWRPSMSCVSCAEKTASVLVFGGVDKDGHKQSLTTVLEFKLVDISGEVPEWIMDDAVVLGVTSVFSKPIQAVEDGGVYNPC
ncbi:Adagio protein 2 [Geodia barretti]|uniref:Adagio protein 2 n=1 Tax=Geodia barretti TaxID=519541 RepID=A0AA35U3D8_GEOBA|nr:Adagio protein 2 [Geodia barretti]